MTGIATHAFIDVNAVIEVHKVGEIIHSSPYQRLATAKTLPHWLEQGRSSPNLRVAIHAGFGGWNTGKTRSLNRSMAVAAVNPQSSHMMLVTERNRLGARHFGIGNVRRTLQFQYSPQQRGDQEDGPVNRGAGYCVRAAMKNLHQSELSVQRGRVHRPGAFVEPHDPLQPQTVVSLVWKKRIIAVSNRSLCDGWELFSAEISPYIFTIRKAIWLNRKPTASSLPKGAVRSFLQWHSADPHALIPNL